MLTLDEIRKRLEHSNLQAVSEETGLAYNVVYRFVKKGTNPYYQTAQKLSEYLENRDG